MARKLLLRAVTEEEERRLRQWARSRTEPARRVQRAALMVLMLDNPGLSAGPAGLRVGFQSPESGRAWVRRFNAQGLAGLEEARRPGRPPDHAPEVRGALVSLAQRKPDSLGYPFAMWTLGRLQQAFQEREGVHLASSTIWSWMEAEGLEWKRQQSWFHEAERHDEAFVEKRGR